MKGGERVTSEQFKQFTIRMPEDMHRQFKAKVASEGKTMLEVILKLVQGYLDESKKGA
jgi:hypothetical protein